METTIKIYTPQKSLYWAGILFWKLFHSRRLQGWRPWFRVCYPENVLFHTSILQNQRDQESTEYLGASLALLTMRMIKIIFATSYFSFLFYAVFFARRRQGVTDRLLNAIPVQNILHSYDVFKAHNELHHFYSNLFGNFLLFIPFPFFLFFIVGVQTRKTAVLCSLLFSTSIELTQFVFKKGVADIDDILLNVLGAIAGIFMYEKFQATRVPG